MIYVSSVGFQPPLRFVVQGVIKQLFWPSSRIDWHVDIGLLSKRDIAESCALRWVSQGDTKVSLSGLICLIFTQMEFLFPLFCFVVSVDLFSVVSYNLQRTFNRQLNSAYHNNSPLQGGGIHRAQHLVAEHVEPGTRSDITWSRNHTRMVSTPSQKKVLYYVEQDLS